MGALIELRSMPPRRPCGPWLELCELLVWATRVCALSLILKWLVTDMITEFASLTFKPSDPEFDEVRERGGEACRDGTKKCREYCCSSLETRKKDRHEHRQLACCSKLQRAPRCRRGMLVSAKLED